MEIKFDTHHQLTVEAKNGLYIARFLPGRMEGWGIGTINQNPNSAEDEYPALAQALVDSIKPVLPEELAFSDCTDGRKREELLDGSPVPNREKLVGADIMIAFAMAEALGQSFFEDPAAPVEVRINTLINFLLDNNLKPSTHYNCGGAAGFVTILQNAIKFAETRDYIERKKSLLPADIFDDSLEQQNVSGYKERLAHDAYKGYSDSLIIKAIQDQVGERAVIRVGDDGTGVHGHRESLIARLQISGAAVDVNNLARITKGKQAFTINDNRLITLAKLFGRGQDIDYRIALMAGEDFTDAGHGTLATNLPTLLVRAA